MKTHQGAAKRVTVRKGGKMQHRKAFAAHHLTGKSASRKRRLARPGEITAGDKKRLTKLIAKG